jgi:hypothetical protein
MVKLIETRDKDGNIIASKLDQFIAEHKDEIGDEAAFNLTLQAMAGKSKEAPEASSQDDCDD